MILWISLGVVLVAAIGVAIYEARVYWGDPVLAFVDTGMVGAIAALILCFFASWIWGTDYVDRDRSNLKAISTDSSMKGSFFLVAGSFSEASTYKFIKETDDGGFFMDEVGIRHAVVYEVKPGDVPHMVKVEEKRSSPWVPWVYSAGYTYEFHVPENSVVESFKIDVND